MEQRDLFIEGKDPFSIQVDVSITFECVTIDKLPQVYVIL